MSGIFQPVTFDESPPLLEASYQLRYQSYCVERRLLRAEDYPNQQEHDEFDRHAIHVGVLNAVGELAGTARIVNASSAGLPFARHCTLFPQETTLTDAGNTVVEISRVCIARRYARRRGDAFFNVPEGEESDEHAVPAHDRRHERDDVYATLVKAVYQATKHIGAMHWIVAMENGLRRRVARYGLPFQLAGPDADYYGLVAPYIMSLAEFDRVIQGRQFATLDDFLIGEEPELPPWLDERDKRLCQRAGSDGFAAQQSEQFRQRLKRGSSG